MNTTQTTPIIFKSNELESIANLIKENGLKVFYSKWSHDNRKPTFFHFTDGINIGYCQAEHGGIRFTTVHKPCKDCDTGFVLQDYMGALYEPTIEDAKKAFIFAPSWASDWDIRAVKKYKNWEEYTQSNNSCTYIEY